MVREPRLEAASIVIFRVKEPCESQVVLLFLSCSSLIFVVKLLQRGCKTTDSSLRQHGHPLDGTSNFLTDVTKRDFAISDVELHF